jgi:NifU-like protein involved in Fe-S cluster formation
MKSKINVLKFLATTSLFVSAAGAMAVEIEPLGKAVGAILHTTKAFSRTVPYDGKKLSFYYSKTGDGKIDQAVFIEHGLYEPDCTHTWAIGMDPRSRKVTEVRVIEMACPHAFPTKSAAFLEQFKGKGPADVATLDSQVTTIAKATGSSKLAVAAVKRTIVAFDKIHGSL